MSVKKKLENYFAKIDEKSKYRPYDIELQHMFVTKPDNENWAKWNEIEIETRIDFTTIEEKFSLEMHQSIKDLFSSYYHFGIEGSIEEKRYSIEANLSRDEKLKEFTSLLENYFSHCPIRSFTPIGVDENSFFILVDNYNGKVYVEDFDLLMENFDEVMNGTFSWDCKGLREKIASNIEEFIEMLEV